MKFSLKKMLVSGLLAGAMTFCAAGAASFDSAAQSLSDLGLLTGTDSGFDLDRPSTRGEAAAMLVRLLGKEAEATELWKTDADSFAFTDMEDAAWAKPYVNWLVKNGLAAGTTDTTFAPRDNCSAQMAATFLLRALGYSDAEGGDFTYFTAMDFAREKGVVDMFNCNEKDFQRDHLVAMCYTTLSRPPKSGGDDLLSKLVADGAVADNDASKAVRQDFADYRELYALSDSMSKATSMAFKMKADIDIGATLLEGNQPTDGGTMKMAMEQDAAIKIDPAKPEGMEMAMSGTVSISMDGETVSVPNKMYFKDGMAYVEAENEKMKMPMSMEQAMEQANIINAQNVGSEPIVVIESMKKTEQNGKTVCDIVYNPKVMGDAVGTVMGTMMETLPDLNDPTVEVSIDKVNYRLTTADGTPESIVMDMTLHYSDEHNKVEMAMKMTMDITAVGDAVKVEFPASFDDYTDIANAA